MPLQEHRYRATILRICRTDTGEESDWSEFIDYHDMNYGQIVDLQSIVAKHADALIVDLLAAGFAGAVDSGFDTLFKRNGTQGAKKAP